jgi:hypothetical protein
MNWQNAVWNALAGSSIYTALVPIIFGALNYFKLWLPSEDEVRRRCRAQREILNENVNQGLCRILEKLQGTLNISDLRGTPPHPPDLIGDHTVELFRIFRINCVFEGIERSVRRTFTFLMVTAAFGILCLAVAFPYEVIRPYISVAAIILFIAQTASVLIMRSKLKRLADLEDET